MKPTAKNSLYFKAFNADYRVNGVLHKLDNSEFRTIVILQAYSDCEGLIHKEDGSVYSVNELSNLIGLNYRTMQKALTGLMDKNLIRIEDKGIYIRFFLDDQFYRERKPQSTIARKNMAQQINETNERLDDIESKINNNGG